MKGLSARKLEQYFEIICKGMEANYEKYSTYGLLKVA